MSKHPWQNDDDPRRRPDFDDDMPDDTPDDDIVYEDFDDVVWVDPDPDIDVIDLDALEALDDEPDDAPDDAPDDEPKDAPVSVAEPEPEPEPEPVPAQDEADTAADTVAVAPDDDDDDAPESTGEDSIDADPVSEDTVSEDTVSEDAHAPAEPSSPDQTPAPESPAEPASPATVEAPPDTVYRVQLMLPPDAAALMLELRGVGDITTMPPPGIALTAHFRTERRAAVEEALTAWAHAHLPLSVEITGVLAEVHKAHQYVAAWTVAPDAALDRAQAALAGALLPLVTPPTAIPTRFPGRITIGERIQAAHYPHVVGAMQREFEQVAWTIAETGLVSMLPEVAPGEWEIARLIAPRPDDYHTR